MYMMANRVVQAGEEWTKWRKEGLKVGGGAGAEEIMSSMMGGPLPADLDGKRGEPEEVVEDDEEEPRRSTEAVEPPLKRRKVKIEDNQLPMGIYEPHSGLVLCQYSQLFTFLLV
jgi:chromatin structure-remodeling complex protein RSC7